MIGGLKDYNKHIYPKELLIEGDDELSTKLYDKLDEFGAHIVKFPFLPWNIPSSSSYSVCISQLISYAQTAVCIMMTSNIYTRC